MIALGFLNCNDDFLGLVLVPGDHSIFVGFSIAGILSIYCLCLLLVLFSEWLNKVVVLLLLYASPSYSMYL